MPNIKMILIVGLLIDIGLVVSLLAVLAPDNHKPITYPKPITYSSQFEINQARIEAMDCILREYGILSDPSITVILQRIVTLQNTVRDKAPYYRIGDAKCK